MELCVLVKKTYVRAENPSHKNGIRSGTQFKFQKPPQEECLLLWAGVNLTSGSYQILGMCLWQCLAEVSWLAGRSLFFLSHSSWSPIDSSSLGLELV